MPTRQKLTRQVPRNSAADHKQAQQHTEVSFDVEQYAYHLWGVNVMNIPCMSKNSVLRLVAELGADFTQKFPDVKHFLSWANLVPDNKISGGQSALKPCPQEKEPSGTGVQTMRKFPVEVKGTIGRLL